MTAFDVLILGSGLAGQSLALRLADKLKVAVVTKRTLEDSASAWAQGGIAAVLDPADGQGQAWFYDKGEVLGREQLEDGRVVLTVRLGADKAQIAASRFKYRLRNTSLLDQAAE